MTQIDSSIKSPGRSAFIRLISFASQQNGLAFVLIQQIVALPQSSFRRDLLLVTGNAGARARTAPSGARYFPEQKDVRAPRSVRARAPALPMSEACFKSRRLLRPGHELW